MSIGVKICGIDRIESIDVAVSNGVEYIGFVFYPPSPRNLTSENAATLIRRLPKNVSRVGLFVDPTNAEIEAILGLSSLDLIQLHGDENAQRVKEVKQFTGLPVMKAIKLAGPEDLKGIGDYFDVADRFLFDAKAPADSKNALPGGNAFAFDWELLRDIDIPLPWMLAGGLEIKNLAQAIAISGAKSVDVSSGVESASGIKSLSLIKDFLDKAKAL